jgi:hypothetical protein
MRGTQVSSHHPSPRGHRLVLGAAPSKRSRGRARREQCAYSARQMSAAVLQIEVTSRETAVRS